MGKSEVHPERVPSAGEDTLTSRSVICRVMSEFENQKRKTVDGGRFDFEDEECYDVS